ncbi:LacI family DNA-binding transcriptional regulator [Agromyces allii]|uniref:LacI family DNA-binding transcriptional regulator n=1 Tax=Agromyces allii TaxID=393607 RepID=A0ABN2QZG3_9MICO|nr:LacI family DNA-binding transcriptional regulator [Agromyces allii]
MNTKNATIADVAARAGVSVPTVSRVLTGAARVSPAKVERVEAAIAELNFRPSAAARTLASRRSQVIAVIAGDTSRYGYAETIRGVEVAARAAGYTVMITVVETADDEEVDRAITATMTQSIAGVVILKFDPPGVAALKRLPADIPVVALSGVRDVGVPQAVLDEARAAEELTTLLLGLGHRTVHHVRVPPSRREDGRTTGWRRALRKAGAPVPETHDAGWEPRTGLEIGRRLAEDPSVTAVFCGNDEIAMGVMRGLADAGLRVPDDVSVAGFDDHPLAEMWSPPLTTAEQDFAGLGRRGFQLLLHVIDDTSDRLYSSERPRIILRESTAAPNPERLRAGAGVAQAAEADDAGREARGA